MKFFYIGCGFLSLFFGIVGAFLPGLPTTPFMLLAATLFLKGNRQLYSMVINHPFTGRFLKQAQRFDKRTLINSLILMWVMILISVFIFFSSFKIRLILIIVGVIGTSAMVVHFKKKRD